MFNNQQKWPVPFKYPGRHRKREVNYILILQYSNIATNFKLSECSSFFAPQCLNQLNLSKHNIDILISRLELCLVL